MFKLLGKQITSINTKINNGFRRKEETRRRLESKSRAQDRELPTGQERDQAMLEAERPLDILTTLAGSSSTVPTSRVAPTNTAGQSSLVSSTTATTLPSSAGAAEPLPDLSAELPAAPSKTASPEEWARFARALELRQQLEGDEDDDEINEEVQKLTGASIFERFSDDAPAAKAATGSKSQPRQPAVPQTAEDGPAVRQDSETAANEPSLEQGEPDPLANVDCDELRFRMAQYIIGPELMNREQDEQHEVCTL
jgi:hypothetical protein